MPRPGPIAIAHAASAVPRGLSPDGGLWELLLRGESLLRPRPHMGVSGPVATFDPEFAGHAPVMLAYAVIRRQWHDFRALGGRPAMLMATTKGDLDDWLAGGQPGIESLCAALDDMISGLPALRRVISNACVSGAQAAIEAAEMLLDAECDRALVVGADGVTPFVAQGFAALGGLSASGARPFDAGRDGLSPGEAGCACVLTRAADAPGAPTMIGWGSSNDANHISGPSRDGSGLALAIERALDGIDRSKIIAICGHGTGTVYNDAMEALAFRATFGARVPPLFGIKGSIGHTMGAAGLVELEVSARVACTGTVPPTVGFRAGEEGSPLDVVHGSPRQLQPGLVLTTNSGFGGMNTAVVVAPGKAPWRG